MIREREIMGRLKKGENKVLSLCLGSEGGRREQRGEAQWKKYLLGSRYYLVLREKFTNFVHFLSLVFSLPVLSIHIIFV